MNPIYINLVVEDAIHQGVLSRILKDATKLYQIGSVFGLRGNGYIKKNLFAFNQAAKISPYLVLTDLDLKTCAPALRMEWMSFSQHPNLIFRIAVREAETWLFADRENFADFLDISVALIDRNPESINNPKEYIINLARRSRQRKIRENLVPTGSANVGKLYNSTLLKFINSQWDIEAARKCSPSLDKLMVKLERFETRTYSG